MHLAQSLMLCTLTDVRAHTVGWSKFSCRAAEGSFTKYTLLSQYVWKCEGA